MLAPSLAIVALFALGATARAQVGHVEQAIVGGQLLEQATLSPTALLGACDGTLVSPHVLLTAAHCVGTPPKHATFGASEQDARVVVEVERCVAHPEFARSVGHDLAFCTVRGDTSAIVPATLIEHADELELGANIMLIGHGYTTGDRSDRTRVARWVNVAIESFDSGELIVGDPEHGACHGDSGGSAFVGAADGGVRLAGVVSRRGPRADGTAGETCSSTTRVTPIQPHLAWLARSAHVRSSAAKDNAGCALSGASQSGSAALPGVLLALWLMLAARRKERLDDARAVQGAGGAK